MRRFLARLTFAFIAIAAPLRAEEVVDLELLLAVDASGSVDAAEFELQIGGIAAAFRDPEVLEAIRSGPEQRIAAALMIWSDARSRKAMSDWMVIGDAASAEAFASLVVSQIPRHQSGPW